MADKTDKAIKIKIMTLGNSDVGKTSFIIKYANEKFSESKISSIGIDLITKEIVLNDKKYILQFYDTAGQERYKSLSFSTIKGSDGSLLMYDITNQVSFDSISKWMEGIEANKGDDFPIVLIGNKCDLADKRVILLEEGEELSKEYNLPFYETSCKDGTNIEKSVLDLVNRIIEKKKTKSIKDDQSSFKIKEKEEKNEIKEKKKKSFWSKC